MFTASPVRSAVFPLRSKGLLGSVRPHHRRLEKAGKTLLRKFKGQATGDHIAQLGGDIGQFLGGGFAGVPSEKLRSRIGCQFQRHGQREHAVPRCPRPWHGEAEPFICSATRFGEGGARGYAAVQLGGEHRLERAAREGGEVVWLGWRAHRFDPSLRHCMMAAGILESVTTRSTALSLMAAWGMP